MMSIKSFKDLEKASVFPRRTTRSNPDAGTVVQDTAAFNIKNLGKEFGLL